METRYFITYNGKTIGPMTKAQMMAYPVTFDTPVCTEDNQMWQPLYNFPEIMQLMSETRSNGCNAADVNTTGKDKIVCGLLAIFLGGLGVQYFYVGKVSAGIISIILTLITCSLWTIIVFIQGIVMMTMTQSQFEQKYVLNPAKFPVF